MVDPTPPGPAPPRFTNAELRRLLDQPLTGLEQRLIAALIECQQRHGDT